MINFLINLLYFLGYRRKYLGSEKCVSQRKLIFLFVKFQFGVALSVALDNGRGDVFLSYCITIGPTAPNFGLTGQLDPPSPFTNVCTLITLFKILFLFFYIKK